MLTHKPIPKFSKDRQPHTSIPLIGGEHHCNARWCEWYYDGTTSQRAMLPYQGKAHMDMADVNIRLAGDKQVPGQVLPQTRRYLAPGLRAAKEGKL